jgi:hypothetical protein
VGKRQYGKRGRVLGWEKVGRVKVEYKGMGKRGKGYKGGEKGNR